MPRLRWRRRTTLADPVTVESKIVRIAKGEVGVGEPTKCNKYWWYGDRPAGCGDDTNGPWCAAFAGWVWDQAGAPGVPKSYAVAGWTSWAKSRKQWKSKGLKPGDAVVYGTRHMGIVVAVHSATNIRTPRSAGRARLSPVWTSARRDHAWNR